MSLTEHLLDPELKEISNRKSSFALSDEVMLQARKDFKPMELGDPGGFNVTREEIFISVDDTPEVRCLLYVPLKDNKALRPGYLLSLIHI